MPFDGTDFREEPRRAPSPVDPFVVAAGCFLIAFAYAALAWEMWTLAQLRLGARP